MWNFDIFQPHSTAHANWNTRVVSLNGSFIILIRVSDLSIRMNSFFQQPNFFGLTGNRNGAFSAVILCGSAEKTLISIEIDGEQCPKWQMFDANFGGQRKINDMHDARRLLINQLCDLRKCASSGNSHPTGNNCPHKSKSHEMYNCLKRHRNKITIARKL